MSNVLYELIKFNDDRKLNQQEFNLEIASLNILEELLEAHGIHDEKDRHITTQLYQLLKSQVRTTRTFEPHLYKHASETDIVDAFCDIQVYAFGEPYKLGYYPIACLSQCSKEINSRVGTIIDGKFVKDKSNEARAKWYKADYKRCKIENKS